MTEAGDIGKIGEDLFRPLCSRAGIVASQPDRDKNGWDFFLELPTTKNSSLPRDMCDGAIECKVQVKTTASNKKSVAVKVSNLEKLSKVNLPAFFCFIELDESEDLKSAHILHVNQDLIEKSLRRIRELEIEGEVEKLHKHTISVGYSESIELDLSDKDSLKKIILGYVPNGIQSYVKRKQEWLNTIGFEDSSYRVDVNFKGENCAQDLIDMYLGLRESMDEAEFSVYNSRFGMTSNKPLIQHSNASVRILQHPREVILEFKENSFSKTIFAINAKSYHQNFISSSQRECIKVRLESLLFEIIADSHKDSVQFNFSHPSIDGRWSLLDLLNSMEFVSYMASSPQQLLIKVVIPDIRQSVSFFRINQEHCSSLYGQMPMSSSWAAHREYKDALESCLSLINEYGLDLNKVHTSMSEIRDKSSTISNMNTYLSEEAVGKTVMLPNGLKVDVNSSRLLLLSQIALLRIGEYHFGLCIGVQGMINSKNARNLIVTRIYKSDLFHFRNGEGLSKIYLIEKIEQFENELRKEGLVPVRLPQEIIA